MFLRNPFAKSLFDARRALLGWAIAITAVGAMYAAFWPSMRDPNLRNVSISGSLMAPAAL